jgi:predicted metal-dependent hydrolase
VVTGDLEDPTACRDAIFRWLCRRARRELVPRLEDVAREHRLDYGRVSVRLQRTRWGSCSRSKNISLNARLLFLMPVLVDYVLLHELCHTREMSHSPRFWTLLGYHDPECRSHRKHLRLAGESMPTWLDHDVEEAQV